MVGTAGRARVRPTPVVLHSLLRCGVFLSKRRIPLVEEVPLGSFVPENPIAESGPVMEGGMVFLHGTDLVLSTLRSRLRARRTPEKICIFKSCAVSGRGK